MVEENVRESVQEKRLFYNGSYYNGTGENSGAVVVDHDFDEALSLC